MEKKGIFFLGVLVFIQSPFSMENLSKEKFPFSLTAPKLRAESACGVSKAISAKVGENQYNYSEDTKEYRSIEGYLNDSSFTQKKLIVGSGYAYFTLECFLEKNNEFYTIDINEETDSSKIKWPKSYPDKIANIAVLRDERFYKKFDLVIFEGLPIHVLFGEFIEENGILKNINLASFESGFLFLRSGGTLVFNVPPIEIVFYEKQQEESIIKAFCDNFFKIYLKTKFTAEGFNWKQLQIMDLNTEVLTNEDEFQEAVKIFENGVTVFQNNFLIPILKENNDIFKKINNINVIKVYPEKIYDIWIRGRENVEFLIVFTKA